MKRNEIDNSYKATSRDYLHALVGYPSFLKLICPENKPYKQLYQWLIENELIFLDENTTLPTMLEIAKKSGIESSKVAKYLRMMYEDIYLLNQNEPDKFVKPDQIQCYLNFKYLYNSAGFTLGLNVMPRIHECFEFYFIHPKTGSSYNYVKDIYHTYDNSGHTLYISLTYERPNLYMQLLREKGYLRHQVSFEESMSSSNYLLDEKLLKLNSNL